jgi:hypothetical protein
MVPGHETVIRSDNAIVPLGPIIVPFTSGWAFTLQPPVLSGHSPDGLSFEATFATGTEAMKDESAQKNFFDDNRQRLPAFQKNFVSQFGSITKPCATEEQPAGRFRLVCAGERLKEGKPEYLIAYAYVGKRAVLFLNFLGEGAASAGLARAEAILAKSTWNDDAPPATTTNNANTAKVNP